MQIIVLSIKCLRINVPEIESTTLSLGRTLLTPITIDQPTPKMTIFVGQN